VGTKLKRDKGQWGDIKTWDFRDIAGFWRWAYGHMGDVVGCGILGGVCRGVYGGCWRGVGRGV
jgi:hypothetical protein